MSLSDPEPDAGTTKFLRPVLDDLITTGGAVMRAIHEEANATPTRRLDFIDAFERVSRAVRRAVVLAIQTPAPPPADNDHRRAARKCIICQIRSAAETNASNPDAEFPASPSPLALAAICHDLARAAAALHSQAWQRQTPPDIRALCTPKPSGARGENATLDSQRK